MPSTQFPDLDGLYARTPKHEDEDGDETITRQWRDVAQRDLERLSRWIEQVPLDDYSRLGWVYVGVRECNPVPWHFFVRELRRVLDLATRHPENGDVFEPFSWFPWPDENASSEPLAALAELVLEALRSPLPRIRRNAARLAGHYLSAETVALEDELRSRVTSDPDVRVRVRAYLSIAGACEEHGLKEPPDLGFADRLLDYALLKLRPDDYF